MLNFIKLYAVALLLMSCSNYSNTNKLQRSTNVPTEKHITEQAGTVIRDIANTQSAVTAAVLKSN